MAARKSKSKTAKPTRIKTQTETAELLNITPRSLRSWESEDWWPEGGRTKAGYDLALIREAQEAHGKAGSEFSEKKKEFSLKHDEGKLERQAIEIQKRRMELHVAEGLLIPRDAVELHLATLLKEQGDLFDKVISQTKKLAGKRNSKKVGDYLQREFDKGRKRIASELEKAARAADSARESSS